MGLLLLVGGCCSHGRPGSLLLFGLMGFFLLLFFCFFFTKTDVGVILQIWDLQTQKIPAA